MSKIITSVVMTFLFTSLMCNVSYAQEDKESKNLDNYFSKDVKLLLNENDKISNCKAFIDKFHTEGLTVDATTTASKLTTLKMERLKSRASCFGISEDRLNQYYEESNDEEGSAIDDHSAFYAIALQGSKQKQVVEKNCTEFLSSEQSLYNKFSSAAIQIDKKTCQISNPIQ
jgi:hypothetical protein